MSIPCLRLSIFVLLTPLPALADPGGLTLDAGQDWQASGLIMRAAPDTAGLPPGDRYHYDTWRLSVRYSLLDGERTRLAFGMTARSGAVPDRPETQGLADSPLLHAHGEYQISPRWQLIGDVDAAGIRPGRDLGLGLQLSYSVSRTWRVAAGYRLQDQTPDEESAGVAGASWFTLGTRFSF